MYIICNLRDKKSKYYSNCVSDVEKIVNNITEKPYEGKRVRKVLDAMTFDDVWQTRQYRIRNVADGLVCRKIYLDNNCSCTDTVNKVKNCILFQLANDIDVEFISIGDEIDCAKQADGGNANDLLVWLKGFELDIPVRIHAADPKYVKNIRNTIHRLKLTEIN